MNMVALLLCQTVDFGVFGKLGDKSESIHMKRFAVIVGGGERGGQVVPRKHSNSPNFYRIVSKVTRETRAVSGFCPETAYIWLRPYLIYIT